MTGTLISLGSSPRTSPTKVFALTTSSVVTPRRRLGSYVPAFLKTSAAMGTVELTGLLITSTIALGQHFAIPSQRVRTIPALMLNKSSLVIPGFRGTPAGIITRSIPIRAFSSCD
uniref:Pco104294 n=1 Tax=Arundo donax TaxID=35708 RepID=A0A0A9EUG6_ARUDO